MRAPDDKHAPIYTDAERSEIARLASLVGHDAEQGRVSGLLGVSSMTLIENLEGNAHLIRVLDDGLSTTPTPKQTTRFLRSQLGAVEMFQGSFGTALLDFGWRVDPKFIDHDAVVRSPEFEKREELHKRLHDVLADVAKLMRGEVDGLSNAGSRSSDSAVQVPVNVFQEHVLNLWNEIGGTESSRPLKIAFVFACTHPAFPGKSKKSVENWFDRHN